MLLEVTRDHLVFGDNGKLGHLERGELILIVGVSPGMQATALCIDSSRVVHITTLDTLENPPTYVQALR